jgi:hypothetical protein
MINVVRCHTTLRARLRRATRRNGCGACGPSRRYKRYHIRHPLGLNRLNRVVHVPLQMYHRSLIRIRSRTATGKPDRPDRTTRRTSDPVIVTIISNRMYRSRIVAARNAQAELEARSFPIVLSRATSDVRLQRRCVYAGTRRTSCVPYDTPHSTSHHLLRSSVQASIAHAMICK